jgi:heme exporter protein B
MAATLRRELTLLWRRKSDSLNPLLFLLMVSSLFPLGVSPAPDVLALLSPGIIWVVALLSCLLSTESMFRSDFDDGSLELMLLNPQPLYFHILVKVLAHWMLTGIPLAIMSPIIALMLNLPAVAIPVLMLSLLLGTLPLVFIGAIGAALTVGLRRGGVLLSLIVLPLYVPVLIFGADAVKRAAEGSAVPGQLAILAAFFMLSFALTPLAVGGALKISVDS